VIHCFPPRWFEVSAGWAARAPFWVQGLAMGRCGSSDSNASGPRFRSFCLWQFLTFLNTAGNTPVPTRPLPNPAAQDFRSRRRLRLLCLPQLLWDGAGNWITARGLTPTSLRRHSRCAGRNRLRLSFRRLLRQGRARSSRRFLRCSPMTPTVSIRFSLRCGSWSRTGGQAGQRGRRGRDSALWRLADYGRFDYRRRARSNAKTALAMRAAAIRSSRNRGRVRSSRRRNQ